ncbi:hypothetical protein SGFS_098100 [Streptomyces graminofaciens]|uniref:Uncharacterized protein n=1 Tax=Streptomyces graminofaciens TaxID=68212 RepID=A0ABM7FN06_9ACTN|nr:hypothetical protein SGFS_098100 [Streptomyces graminofaciens]
MAPAPSCGWAEGDRRLSRITNARPIKGRSTTRRTYRECTRRPGQPQSGQAGGCPHDDASTASLSSVACTAVTRTSIPGNSTSSTAAAPIPGQSTRETFPQSYADLGIHGIAA